MLVLLCSDWRLSRCYPMSSYYLGVDPGRSKTGLALTDEQGKIIRLHIAATAEILQELKSFVGEERLEAIIMGDGTNNKAIGKALKEIFPWKKVYLVGEAHSTEEARALYWVENPPKGWRKILPLGLQVPLEPLDAYAAVIQVRRWLKENK